MNYDSMAFPTTAVTNHMRSNLIHVSRFYEAVAQSLYNITYHLCEGFARVF